MACCNRRREGLASDPTARAPAPRVVPPASNRAAIRYLGGEAITVRGPVTGLAYAFSPGRPNGASTGATSHPPCAPASSPAPELSHKACVRIRVRKWGASATVRLPASVMFAPDATPHGTVCVPLTPSPAVKQHRICSMRRIGRRRMNGLAGDH